MPATSFVAALPVRPRGKPQGKKRGCMFGSHLAFRGLTVGAVLVRGVAPGKPSRVVGLGLDIGGAQPAKHSSCGCQRPGTEPVWALGLEASVLCFWSLTSWQLA